MKKSVSLILMLVTLLSPFSAYSEALKTTGKDPVSEPFKELSDSEKKRLGDNYIAIDLDTFKAIELKAAQAEILQAQLDKIVKELDEFKTYSTRLEKAIKDQKDYITLQDEHIDYQAKLIEDLQPTFWSKNKFWAGMITGFVLMGGAAYVAGQLSD